MSLPGVILTAGKVCVKFLVISFPLLAMSCFYRVGAVSYIQATLRFDFSFFVDSLYFSLLKHYETFSKF